MTPVLAADTFAGQSVLVTGGTSGIGAATADVLADLGAEVYALGLPPTDDAELPRHERVRVVQQDVTDRDALSHRITAYDRRLSTTYQGAELDRIIRIFHATRPHATPSQLYFAITTSPIRRDSIKIAEDKGGAARRARVHVPTRLPEPNPGAR
ncbi:SDR family NAD(P)-dependent oxidoreductase [Streptomyces caniscabiei]|uniref:SDR family NAD(P)-dependent oxidoreductase n=1 Tax=Streptomyces caniscabiei TaxID=2746961 RepID=UPI001F2C463A|nr:SDR family NAD(P)-dependent oxidoreductase [Streptomyces caniscabiei]